MFLMQAHPNTVCHTHAKYDKQVHIDKFASDNFTGEGHDIYPSKEQIPVKDTVY